MPTETELKPGTKRILVVEDHAVVRDGFVALINQEPDLEVCGEADSAPAALTAIERHRPNLVLADMMLREGNGMELLKDSKARFPDIPFLMISMQDEEVYAERCIRAGAGGYIMKHAATNDFLSAIRLVLDGEIYLSNIMSARMLQRLAGNNKPEKGGPNLDSLTDRELQVLQLIGSGMNTRDIAPKLGISPKTVAAHRENIKVKLGLRDGRALLQFAMDWLRGMTN